MKKGNFIAAVSLVTLMAAFFRLYGIWSQAPLESEVFMVQGASDYMQKGVLPAVMWWHPPLRNILIHSSTSIFGFDAVGVRFWSILFGILSIPLLALLTLELTGDRRAGCVSSFLLAVDPLHITFSRQTIQEVYIAFFALSGVYLTLRYIRTDRLSYLIAAGLVYGLGLSSKLQAGFTLAACWLLIVRPGMLEGERVSGRPIYMRVVSGVSMLALLPFAVYVSAYIPWLLRGYDLREWLYMQQVSLGVTSTTVFDIASNPGRAIDWFIRLTGYASIVISDGPHLTLGVNNLIVWWLVVPSFVYLAYRYFKAGAREGGFVSILFWFSYIPLIVIPTRPIYLLTAASVIPFAFMGVSRVMMQVKDLYGIGDGWLFGYLAVVLISSAALFPLTCGWALDYAYLLPVANRFSPH